LFLKTQESAFPLKEWKIFFLNVFFLAYGFYGGIKVYSLLPISIAYPVLQFGSILTVISAIIFLGEKNNLKNRIIGSIIATAGVILVGIK
jgi:drug/metabolite transporter (DMT)-like permease